MRTSKAVPFILSVLLGTALIAACGDSGSKSSGTNAAATNAAATTAAASGGVTAPAAGGGTAVNIAVSDTKGTDGPMTLVPDVTSAKAGDVTFTVKNTGTVDHEVVVLKTDTPFDQLKVGATEADKVDEAASVGETGDPALKPGETRSFTLKGLAAGNYVLVCNIAKHYGLGMRAAFTISA